MANKAPLRRGSKELYLPTFRVILRRTLNLPPTQACFIVPLWFSKLDLRDYLFNAYNVRIGRSIRSYVQQSRVRQGKDQQYARPQPRRWHRPRSTKHMTVDLEEPFVWPELPESWADWNKTEVELATEEQKVYNDRVGPEADMKGVREDQRKSMREQAQALLEGRQRWTPAATRNGGVMMSWQTR
ncbi:Ribosomal protein L23 [Teratosphaeria destructans]|uniref:Large ribosomal subunit protein uL23m n=1 Tax=Teratosphaeria destructans TaxID=418781 RepID=A0A9W7SIF5_9PEZI|nr:Ribosomal protein L23 [Teratosphaeria destructans]